MPLVKFDKAAGFLPNECIVGGVYENQILCIGAGTIGISRLRRGNSGGNNNDDNSRGYDNWPGGNSTGDARSVRGPDSAGDTGGDTNGGARTGLYLDAWLLALDWSRLCLGTWELGFASETSGCVGRGGMGATARRLGLGGRSLAVTQGAAVSQPRKRNGRSGKRPPLMNTS